MPGRGARIERRAPWCDTSLGTVVPARVDTVTLPASCNAEVVAVTNRREMVLDLLRPERRTRHVPAAFFIHFDERYRQGQAAVDRHLAFFEHTGMDVVKVQYEDRFPLRPEIQRPADWARLPVYGLDFYDNQLRILEQVLAATRDDALVIQTMYSPFMQACTTVGRDVLKAHISAEPEAVCEGMARITESMLAYVRACIELGVDGFYASSQGGDTSMFAGSPRFEQCIKPYDLELMREMDGACRFNVLHICDYWGGYRDLAPFRDYPGHVVSTPHHLEPGSTGVEDIAAGRPTMGGMDRHGVIATGSRDAIEAEVARVLASAPERFFLGADCTLPGDVSWDNIRIAVDAAHQAR